MSHEETNETSSDSPVDTDLFTWPVATLDPVEKMRVMAAGLPYCAVRETLLDADFDRVWNLITDFENETPRYEGLVNKVEILERTDTELRLASRMISGFRIEVDVRLEPGWCLMHSRMGDIGMAARPEGDSKTRLIHFEGARRLGRILRPFFHWNIGGDFRRLAALLDR